MLIAVSDICASSELWFATSSTLAAQLFHSRITLTGDWAKVLAAAMRHVLNFMGGGDGYRQIAIVEKKRHLYL